MKHGMGVAAVAWALLGAAATAAWAQANAPSTQPIRIEVSADWAKEKGDWTNMLGYCVGAGRANEGLRADWQRDLAVAAKECGFKYIRFHGIFHEDMGVYGETRDGKPIYNFQYVDELYDYLLSQGVRPFVEISFTPAKMASGSKTVFWWKSNVTPPKDYGQWEALVRAFVQHLTERYGADEVSKWYFEVWNEPNYPAFYSADRAEYFKLYASTARAVKAVNKGYRVGGPATAGAGWVPELLAYCRDNSVPIDFVSTHMYGDKMLGLETGQRVVATNDPSLIGAVKRTREQIKASAFPDLPLHYTEWNRSPSDRDPFHDYYLSCAYVLDKAKKVQGVADSMSYWTFTDIFEESGPPMKPFHGGFGMINLQGLKKPSFFAFHFLNELGPKELACDSPSAFVCKSADGVQALLWDYAVVNPPWNGVMPPTNKGSATLSLAHLPPGQYDLSVTRVGQGINDVYSDYLNLGAPSWLTQQEVRDLSRRDAGGAEIMERVTVPADGSFSRELPIRENDVYFVTLKHRGE